MNEVPVFVQMPNCDGCGAQSWTSKGDGKFECDYSGNQILNSYRVAPPVALEARIPQPTSQTDKLGNAEETAGCLLDIFTFTGFSVVSAVGGVLFVSTMLSKCSQGP